MVVALAVAGGCHDDVPPDPAVVIVYRPAAPASPAELDRAAIGLHTRLDERGVDARFDRRRDTIVAVLPADDARRLAQMTSIIHRVAPLDVAVVAPSSGVPCELGVAAQDDGIARALGIEAHVAADAGAGRVDCYLLARERIALVTYLALVTSRPGAPRVPDDRRLWIERTVDGPVGWRTRYLEHPLLLSGSFVVGAEAWFEGAGTDFGVVIELDPAAVALAAVLAEPGPRDLAVLLDGQVEVVLPQDRPMSAGRLHLLLGPDDDDAAAHEYFALMSVLQTSYVPALVEVSRTAL